MKRQKLLTSPQYWLVQWQNDLYGVINNYMIKKNINRSQLAKELGVTKGYVTQILKGDFNHKISKLIELSLACGKIPTVEYLDLENYIKEDSLTRGTIEISNTRPVKYSLFHEPKSLTSDMDSDKEMEDVLPFHASSSAGSYTTIRRTSESLQG